MAFGKDFLRLTVLVHLKKNEYFKSVSFLLLFWSISYNNMVVTKQIHFSPIF